MTYEGYEALTVDVVDGVGTVIIANPPINLFDLKLYSEMARLTAELAVDGDVRVVVLRSANPEFFIAHFDVSVILTLPTDLPEPTELNDFHAMCERFRTMPKATIASCSIIQNLNQF
jgi:enoyl-CoA hydratase/carnithine racemase